MTGSPLAHALARHRQGDVAGARRLYAELLAHEPENAEAMHLAGVAALQMDEPEEAIRLIGQAIARADRDPRMHTNLGEALRTVGRLDDALASYRRARLLDPAFAQAINNEGAILVARGDLVAAQACFRHASSLDPSYTQARVNLGRALRLAGDADAALGVFAEVVGRVPGNLAVRQEFARVAAVAEAAGFDDVARSVLAATLQTEGVFLDDLVRPALALLRRDGSFTALQTAGDDRIIAGGAGIDDALTNPILIALLNSSLIAEPELERLLARLRRLCLRSFTSPGGGLIARHPSFVAALACQCFLTDFAYAASAEEEAAIDQAAPGQNGEGDRAQAARRSVILALYRPIADLAASDLLAGDPAWASLFRLAVQAPRQDRATAYEVPDLTRIAGDSAAVREFYEAAPYPRWITSDRRSPVPLAHVLGALFPGIVVPTFAHRPVRALIAGCGTGKHAIDSAMLYRTEQMLAIDLSRPSLAYGKRMAAQFGLGHIRFARGDITALAEVAATFQVVESVGVVHHTVDPEATCRLLVERLESDGLLKLGLYSTVGRRQIHAARSLLRAGLPDRRSPTAADLQAVRQKILSLPPGDPLRAVTRLRDFYSLTGLRDLLVNPIEHTFTLPEVAALLSRLRLALLGFQFDNPRTPLRFKQEYPDSRPNDLAAWDAYEQAHPDTFTGMYQFWCRKQG